MTGPIETDKPETTSASTETVIPPAGLAAEAAEASDATDTVSTSPSAEAMADAEAAKPKRRTRSAARKTRSVELILTIAGGPEGEWQADLRHGTERVVQNLTLSAAAVAKAARELHPEISGGIEAVLDQTRRQHRERLEQLESEMRRVKQALVELEDNPDE